MTVAAKASTNDTRTALEAALKQTYGGRASCYVQDFDPVDGWVIFTCYPQDNIGVSPATTYKGGFSQDSDGSVTLSTDPPVAVEQRTTYVPVTASASPMAAMKAAKLDDDEMTAWFEGRTARRLLVIPFGGPIPSSDGKGRDMDVEFFDETTDIKPDWFPERPVDWHHSQDPTGLMNGVLIGKADRLGTLDGVEGEPDEQGWWADIWMKAGERRLSAVKALVARGAQLFGSSYAYPNLVRRGKAGHIDVWPYMIQTLSTSPQNTLSAFRSAKAALDVFDRADITVMPALRDVLTELDALTDLSAAAANGRPIPARDLLARTAKAGRELSGRNLAEVDEWLEMLDGIANRARSLRDRVRSKYEPTTSEGEKT